MPCSEQASRRTLTLPARSLGPNLEKVNHGHRLYLHPYRFPLQPGIQAAGEDDFTAPIIFTFAGMLLVLAMPQLHEMDVERESLLKLAELGLVMLLFTDASHIDLKTLQSRERLPLRLLTVGMLLTIVLGALAARAVFPGFSVWEAGILAAILAPTDAGLGQVIVQSPRVPMRIRQALNVEAGLNDGLSVPFLMFFIAVARVGTEGAARSCCGIWESNWGWGRWWGSLSGWAAGSSWGRPIARVGWPNRSSSLVW